MLRQTRHAILTLSALCLATIAQAQQVIYDPALGTLPQAQGFTLEVSGGTSPSPTDSGGILNQGPTDYAGLQYWQKQDVSFNFDTGFTLEGNLNVISSTYSTPSPNGGVPDSQRSGYYFDAIDTLGREFTLGIASNGVTLNTDEYESASNGIQFLPFDTTNAFHQYHLIVANGSGSLYIDNSLIGSTPVGSAISGYSSTFANRVFLGMAH